MIIKHSDMKKKDFLQMFVSLLSIFRSTVLHAKLKNSYITMEKKSNDHFEIGIRSHKRIGSTKRSPP